MAQPSANATPPDWRHPNDYSYTAALSAERWAWEFLRRNPEYRHDWQAFITRWCSLEADYGKAPNRDFSRWKNDPRAYVSEQDTDLICPDELGAACIIEDNKILIECWMGAKWGFYKFPLDPDYAAPDVPNELLWREQELDLASIAAEAQQHPAAAHLATLHFDLRLSLPEQLEAARLQLGSLRQARQKQGKLKVRIRDNSHDWTLCLRYLDAIQAGVDSATISAVLQADVSAQANALMQCGYRKILLMK
ncbi:hypothetical protein J9253_12365 [Thiothrix litoralis]|jgi:hypothetical protein|uniref:Transcriptional regulator-like domain-containing protein n=1 Tax=Thiothrix litoralis TaxID=2891210 RepID=A0ABX7WRL8_9GAMM|nr:MULTISPECIES: DUF6499 domain-containing protein [Thiothrix]QTR44813.1 hypothetical protein J9253_12365 [Thiothrix litoralis]WMP16543.1 DUF6499 domain-containing protein [Thiothrix lacustris]